jgi:phenylacetic acid degradation operon negative regulatory protein
MLFDLYGDFAIEGGRPGSMRLAAIVRLAEVLGISPVGVRAAVVRLAHEGWLVGSRHGRETTYTLTQRGWQLVQDGRQRIFEATAQVESWDGTWCLVALSVPEARRDVRDRLRKELTWLGFGSPSAGLYISPHDHLAEVERLAAELEALELVQMYRATATRPIDPRDLVARAWDNLEAVNARYTAFIGRFGGKGSRVRTDRLSDQEAFRMRFELASHFRHCLCGDPELPDALAPVDWHGFEARRLFLKLHARVTAGGMRYFDAVTSG